MGIKKYFASKDNTITNAFKDNLSTRATGSNMGVSDILEAFVIHGQTSASIAAANAEQSRILIQFPVSSISADMSDGTLPSSTGSIQFYLNLYNAPHGSTLPEDFNLDVCMLSQSWSEGRGLDMDNYSDIGSSNWVKNSSGSFWGNEGGSFLTGSNSSGSAYFPTGVESMSLNVSEQVYKWLGDCCENYGFLLKFPDSVVSGSDTMYTKKFFARSSEFYFYRPVVEARWDSSRKDNRGSFFVSSSNATAANNLNTLYMYNIIRGQLANIPNLTGNGILLELYSGSAGPAGSTLDVLSAAGAGVTAISGGLLSENGITHTGIYTASFASTATLDPVFDVWYTGGEGSRIEFFTGSYTPERVQTSEVFYDMQYISSITNLHDSYIQGQKPQLRVFARNKDWSPNIYTVATKKIVPEIIEDAYYRVIRTIDNLEIIPFGTGSSINNFTRLSYDVSGNYFDLDTSYLEPGYSYGIQFAYYLQGAYRQQTELFKFRIEEEEV
jgi:hypothetical protein